jgi:hypothetical protein
MRMSIGDKLQEIEQRAREAGTEAKKDAKNAWADTKAAAEKAKNEIEAEVDKM